MVICSPSPDVASFTSDASEGASDACSIAECRSECSASICRLIIATRSVSDALKSNASLRSRKPKPKRTDRLLDGSTILTTKYREESVVGSMKKLRDLALCATSRKGISTESTTSPESLFVKRSRMTSSSLHWTSSPPVNKAFSRFHSWALKPIPEVLET